MDRRLKLSLAAAAVAAAVTCAWALFAPARIPAPPIPVRLAKSPPAVVAHCKRAAELLYDVHWAAACFKIGEANDCMLPDVLAARVNPILDSEEARCLSSELQARAHP